MMTGGIAKMAQHINFALVRTVIWQETLETTFLLKQEVHSFLRTYLSKGGADVN